MGFGQGVDGYIEVHATGLQSTVQEDRIACGRKHVWGITCGSI